MSIARWKAAAAGVLAVGLVGTSVGVLAGQTPGEKPIEQTQRVQGAKGTTLDEVTSDRAAIAALEKRIEEIERRLEFRSARVGGAGGPEPRAMPVTESLFLVTSPCAGEVERVLVKKGDTVKVGTSLLRSSARRSRRPRTAIF